MISHTDGIVASWEVFSICIGNGEHSGGNGNASGAEDEGVAVGWFSGVFVVRIRGSVADFRFRD